MKTGGVRRYIEKMTKAIIRHNTGHNIVIFHNCNHKLFNSDVKEVILQSKIKFICDYLIAPRKINELDLDLVWFPKNILPYGVKTRSIVSIHDLAYFFPELKAYPLKDTAYMKFMMKRSCKKTDRLIAVSQNTKRDIQRVLGRNDVHVIYEGTDYCRVNDVVELQRVKKKYNLPDKFVLYSGNLSPRKNLKHLIEACKALPSNIKLIICGYVSWNESVPHSPKISHIGFIDEADMQALYSLALVYVYPSLYEGFGLPILEAQACGSPVVCSNNSSIFEVGGKAVKYVDTSILGIRRGLLEVIENIILREKLIKDGYENIKRFNWDDSAKKFLKLCESLACK